MHKISSLTVFCEHAEIGINNVIKNLNNIINYAYEKKLTFIQPEQLPDLFDDKLEPNNYILLTFDDGQESLFENVIPNFLRTYKIKCISFVIPLHFTFHKLYTNFDFFIRNKDVFTLGSHTLTHTLAKLTEKNKNNIYNTKSPKLMYYKENTDDTIYCYGLITKNYNIKTEHIENDTEYHNRLYSEIVYSKEWIERATNQDCNFFAYPWGIFNKNVLNIVKAANYKLGFSINVSDSSVYTIPRIYVNDINKPKRKILINNVEVICNLKPTQTILDKKFGLWK